jgi:hypothetical protein
VRLEARSESTSEKEKLPVQYIVLLAVERDSLANLSSSSAWSKRSTLRSSTNTHASSAAYKTCLSVKGLWLQSLMRVDLSRGLPSTAKDTALSPTACLRR